MKYFLSVCTVPKVKIMKYILNETDQSLIFHCPPPFTVENKNSRPFPFGEWLTVYRKSASNREYLFFFKYTFTL